MNNNNLPSCPKQKTRLQKRPDGRPGGREEGWKTTDPSSSNHTLGPHFSSQDYLFFHGVVVGRDGEVEIQLNLPQSKRPVSSWSSFNFGFIKMMLGTETHLSVHAAVAEGYKVRQKKGKRPTNQTTTNSNLTLRKKKCFSLFSLSIHCQISSKKRKKKSFYFYYRLSQKG